MELIGLVLIIVFSIIFLKIFVNLGIFLITLPIKILYSVGSFCTGTTGDCWGNCCSDRCTICDFNTDITGCINTIWSLFIVQAIQIELEPT